MLPYREKYLNTACSWSSVGCLDAFEGRSSEFAICFTCHDCKSFNLLGDRFRHSLVSKVVRHRFPQPTSGIQPTTAHPCCTKSIFCSPKHDATIEMTEKVQSRKNYGWKFSVARAYQIAATVECQVFVERQQSPYLIPFQFEASVHRSALWYKQLHNDTSCCRHAAKAGRVRRHGYLAGGERRPGTSHPKTNGRMVNWRNAG